MLLACMMLFNFTSAKEDYSSYIPTEQIPYESINQNHGEKAAVVGAVRTLVRTAVKTANNVVNAVKTAVRTTGPSNELIIAAETQLELLTMGLGAAALDKSNINEITNEQFKEEQSRRLALLD